LALRTLRSPFQNGMFPSFPSWRKNLERLAPTRVVKALALYLPC
jgi:hypothetical protein